MSNDRFTLAAIAAAMAAMPKPPPYRYCVCKPEYYVRLQRETPTDAGPFQGAGIQIFPKFQTVAAWLFADHRTMHKYLAGELTELDLLSLVQTGGVRPDESPKIIEEFI